jgi:hypothetical protein
MIWPWKKRSKAPEVRSLATFKVDFGEPVCVGQKGGRNVAAALTEIIRGIGWNAEGPIDDDDHGWAVDADSGGERVWRQVTDFGDEILLQCIRSGASRSAHIEFLHRLHAALLRDGRFRELAWATDYSASAVLSPTPGVDEP